MFNWQELVKGKRRKRKRRKQRVGEDGEERLDGEGEGGERQSADDSISDADLSNEETAMIPVSHCSCVLVKTICPIFFHSLWSIQSFRN